MINTSGLVEKHSCSHLRLSLNQQQIRGALMKYPTIGVVMMAATVSANAGDVAIAALKLAIGKKIGELLGNYARAPDNRDRGA
jgi:hypothetical protein